MGNVFKRTKKGDLTTTQTWGKKPHIRKTHTHKNGPVTVSYSRDSSGGPSYKTKTVKLANGRTKRTRQTTSSRPKASKPKKLKAPPKIKSVKIRKMKPMKAFRSSSARTRRSRASGPTSTFEKLIAVVIVVSIALYYFFGK